MDMVSFRLPGHGDTALSNMNFLRTQQHFCDVTIVAGGRRMFRGHKVVLAACSAFLRDQFLLNPSSELQVRTSPVVCELLQSCYTGMLQFSAKEIVNYLTAASYLQMEHVVEKCRGALSQYMQPRSRSPICHAWGCTDTDTGIGIGPNTELLYSLKNPDTTQHVISAIFRQRNTDNRMELLEIKDVYEAYVCNEYNVKHSVLTTHTNEHRAADESVAVVGSTSCVAGPVVCEQCGLAFSSTQDLAMHSLSTHRLYVCPCCGKHFSHSSNLNRHMIVHRGVSKLHCCPLCHKTFTQKSTLCDHMNLHSGERPHVCAYCHVSFAHKPALRRHLKEQHGRTTAQNYLEMQRNNEGGAGKGV
uniref:Zinc finger and BTB domain containing 12, tandem duplicate 1 n=1 Tax=Sinocyclocheilus rhinocerous TaxID=307959 RepID=A0A673I1H4_9TELE